MKKVALLVVLLVGAVVLAKRFRSKMMSTDWEQRFEHLPDNAPPKWMFRNIAAIRANTERIVAMLERERSEPAATSS